MGLVFNVLIMIIVKAYPTAKHIPLITGALKATEGQCHSTVLWT
jgi:hypothetical protein